MIRNKESIIELLEKEDEISVYEFYEVHGHGVQESPYVEGITVGTFRCTPFEAYMISETLNIKKYGTLSERTSWETPVISYRKSKDINVFNKIDL